MRDVTIGATRPSQKYEINTISYSITTCTARVIFCENKKVDMLADVLMKRNRSCLLVVSKNFVK
jgi:hypothetical protein